jgi:hypothetical protein
MAPNRVRSFYTQSGNGIYIKDSSYPYTNINEQGVTDLAYDYIRDTVAVGNGHDMYIEHRKQPDIPFWDGEHYDGSTMHIRQAFFTPRLRSLTYELGNLSIAGSPDYNQATVDLLKKTNPSREYINLPVFALELKKLPQLLLKRTNQLGEDLARGRLSLEYGWKPFVKDLVKFADLQNQITGRVRELKALQRSGIRRKRTIFRGSATSSKTVSLSTTNGFILDADLTTTTQRHVWGFCKWNPTANSLGDVPTGYMVDIVALASVLSLYPDPSVIYEYIPFSWLLDWCSNVGDYLHASRNIVGASPSHVQLMYEDTTEQKVRLRVSGSISPFMKPSKPLEFTRHLQGKGRARIYSWSAQAQMPFLNERQVMILGDIVRAQFGPKARRR